MKLKFGILWIEDEPDPDQKADMKENVRQSGFEAEIKIVPNGKDIKKHADDQQKYHLYDLILIDLNLSDNQLGDDLAVEARKLFAFTPILFYSGNKSDTELRKKIANLKVEGVYCSYRDDLIKRSRALISDFAQSIEQPSGMRGLAAQVVAEIDESLRKMIPLLTIEKGESEAVGYITSLINDQLTDVKNKVDELKNLSNCLDSLYVDSSKLYRTFRHYLKKHIDTLSESQRKDSLIRLNHEFENYDEKVLGVRNTLAHSRGIKDNDGYVIKYKSGTKEIVASDYRALRSDFIKYLECIKNIQNILEDKQNN